MLLAPVRSSVVHCDWATLRGTADQVVVAPVRSPIVHCDTADNCDGRDNRDVAPHRSPIVRCDVGRSRWCARLAPVAPLRSPIVRCDLVHASETKLDRLWHRFGRRSSTSTRVSLPRGVAPRRSPIIPCDEPPAPSFGRWCTCGTGSVSDRPLRQHVVQGVAPVRSPIVHCDGRGPPDHWTDECCGCGTDSVPDRPLRRVDLAASLARMHAWHRVGPRSSAATCRGAEPLRERPPCGTASVPDRPLRRVPCDRTGAQACVAPRRSPIVRCDWLTPTISFPSADAVPCRSCVPFGIASCTRRST